MKKKKVKEMGVLFPFGFPVASIGFRVSSRKRSAGKCDSTGVSDPKMAHKSFQGRESPKAQKNKKTKEKKKKKT